jgi:hypothetical protein
MHMNKSSNLKVIWNLELAHALIMHCSNKTYSESVVRAYRAWQAIVLHCQFKTTKRMICQSLFFFLLRSKRTFHLHLIYSK